MQTIPAKTIVQRTKAPSAWFGFEYNMNLYQGCCHGCIYCDSRSDCYNIQNFSQVRVKANALRIVRDELSRKVKTGVIGTGAMSDPYNPFEKKENVTRHAFELADAYGFGVGIATKSDLALRDLDVLQSIRSHSPVVYKTTITTVHDELAAKLEPHAPSSTRRFKAMETLAANGIFSGVLLMPVMPFITDSPADITALIDKAAAHGARFIYPGLGVTSRSGQREYMLAGLDSAFPGEGLSEKYRKRFGSRYHNTCPNAKKLWAIFCEACNKHGLLYNMQDIIAASRSGYGSTQLSFL